MEENEGGHHAVRCAGGRGYAARVAAPSWPLASWERGRGREKRMRIQKQKPAYIFLSLDSDEKLEMQRSSWRITREV